MNKIFLVGRLADNPRPFTTKNNIPQSRIDIACVDIRDRNETYFFPCVAWNSPAKYINSFLKKGDSVSIDGKLIRRSYMNKDGKNVWITEIVIENINSINSKKNAIESLDNPLNESLQKNVKEEKTIFVDDDKNDNIEDDQFKI